MIAIMGVDSADVISKADSDTATIRMIPNNRLKLESNELSFYKPLFEQECKVISDEYITKQSMPEFLWKFIQLAISKPSGITADNYNSLCQILLSTPNLNTSDIYSFSSQQIQYPANNLNRITIVDDTNGTGYKFPNGLYFNTQKTFNPINARTTLSAKGYFQQSSSTTISLHSTVTRNAITNPTIGTSLSYSTSSISFVYSILNSKTTRVTLPAVNGVIPLPSQQWCEIITESNKTENKSYITLKSGWERQDQRTITSEQTITVSNGFRDIEYMERIGGRVYLPTGATTNTTVTGEKIISELKFIIDETPLTIIEFNKEQTIKEELLTIV